MNTITKFNSSKIILEANKKFDDAIFRVKNDSDVTAVELWGMLHEAQNSSNTNSFAVCESILKELEDRGQIFSTTGSQKVQFK